MLVTARVYIRHILTWTMLKKYCYAKAGKSQLCRDCGNPPVGHNARLHWLCQRCIDERRETVITIEVREDGELVAQAKMDSIEDAIRISRWRKPFKLMDQEVVLKPEEHLWSSICHMMSFLFAIEDRD